MKLHNHTLKYLSIAFLLIVGLWGILFHLHIKQQIGASLNRNLSNDKLDFIQAAQRDTAVLATQSFSSNIYHVKQIKEKEALQIKDRYRDKKVYLEGEKVPMRTLITAFELYGRYYKLEITTSTVEEEALVRNLLYAIIVLYLALLLSILFVNNLLLRSVWKPFYAIIAQLERFQPGQGAAVTAPPTSIVEFRSLNKTIESLIKRAEETFSGQRQFVENASHELQTPIAISLNKLELLLEDESLSSETVTVISQVIRSLERLSRLNKTLLLLTKIENNQFLKVTEVNFNELVQHSLEEFQDLAMHKNIQVLLDEDDRVLRFSMNEDLAATLVLNLLKNAFVHNVPEGKVWIKLQPHTLEIANTGTAKPLDPNHMFNRFYKNSENKQSTGLGLAIVKAIATLYNLEINYAYREERHVITVRFIHAV